MGKSAPRRQGGYRSICGHRSAWLDFPASHPMSRWGKLGGGTIKHVGTQDSKVDFRDLPSELKTSAVVREFGEEEEEEAGKRQASGPTIVCGSTSEVKNDPILGEAYEFVSTGEETSKKSELRAQKSDVWINAVISAKDQLRQRVAHALSTIMPSVPSDITGGDSTEKYTGKWRIHQPVYTQFLLTFYVCSGKFTMTFSSDTHSADTSTYCATSVTAQSWVISSLSKRIRAGPIPIRKKDNSRMQTRTLVERLCNCFRLAW